MDRSTAARNAANDGQLALIPVTVLMGQAPAGLNATGAMDLRSWYDRVETYRTREILPAYQQVVRMLGLGLPSMQGPDGELTIAEFKAKRAALLATIATAEAGGPEPTPAPAPAAPLAPETATVNEARAADGKGELRKDGERDPDGDLTIAAYRAKHSRVKLTPRDW